MPQPAIITTDEDRQEISKAISEQLHQPQLNLAGSAFKHSHQAIIQRRQLMGRELTMPEKFSLWRKDNNCVLVHDNTKVETTIPNINCQTIATTNP